MKNIKNNIKRRITSFNILLILSLIIKGASSYDISSSDAIEDIFEEAVREKFKPIEHNEGNVYRVFE